MVMHEKKNLFSFGTIIQHLFSTWLMNLAKVSYWQSVSEILMCIVSKRFCSHAHHCGVADDAWFVSVFYASTMEKTPYFWWWMREYKQIRPTFLVSIHSTWPHFGSASSNINRCIDDFTLCSEVWTGKTNVYGVGFLSRLPCGRHPRREIEEGKREKSTLVAKWNGLIGGGTFTFAFSLLMQSTSFTWSVFHLLNK